MHSRKSRTFRSYIRNARARVGKVAETRDISNRYRSRCLFDSSFILFLFFFLFPPLSLFLSLHSQGLLMPRLEFDTLEKRGNYIVSRRFERITRGTCRVAQDSARVYIYISASRNLWTNLGREICPGTTRLLLIYCREMRGHES